VAWFNRATLAKGKNTPFSTEEVLNSYSNSRIQTSDLKTWDFEIPLS